MRRAAAFALLTTLTTPVLSQELDCAAQLTQAIAAQDGATLDRLVTDKADRELIDIARASLKESVEWMEAAKTRIGDLRALKGIQNDLSPEQGDIMLGMLGEAMIAYRYGATEATKYQAQLDAVVKNACAGKETTTTASLAVLERLYIEPAPTEWDWKEAKGGGWTATVGDVTYTLTNGSLSIVRPGLTATHKWTPPPDEIPAEGFTTRLSVDGETTAGNWHLVTIAQGAWFRYDPDPAQTSVTLSANTGGNNATVRILPPAEVKYGFDYKFNIGGAFAAGVDYYYSAPKAAP